jgi:hypothetical protein
MRTNRLQVILAASVLVVAVQGCDSIPVALDDPASTAQFSSNAQRLVDLCHRGSGGDFTRITVADAAYATHMEHGDRIVGNGECLETSRLEVLSIVEDSDVSSFLVTIFYTLNNDTRLGTCGPNARCVFYAPTGSRITLFSQNNGNTWDYAHTWSDPTCSGHNDSTCVMNGDLSVTLSAYVLPDY